MGWILRISGAIIGLFVLGAVAGFFVSPHVPAERSIIIEAAPEDVFPYLSDLNDYALWNPWQGARAVDNYVVGGSERGVGQQAVWTCAEADCLSGTQHINVIEPPELVQTELNLNGNLADATYAVRSSGNLDGTVMVLMQVKYNVGGFPYIQRLLKSRRHKQLTSHIDAGFQRLSAELSQTDIP